MNRELKRLIDERFYGVEKISRINVKVDTMDGYERVKRVRRERGRRWRMRLGNMLMVDGEQWRFWRWVAWLVFGRDKR